MDYDKLSDEELLKLYNQKVGGSSPSVDYDSMSDEELLQAYQAKSKPKATWEETVKGGLSDLGKTLSLGGLSVLGAFEDVDEYLRQNSPNPKRRQMEPKTSTGELMAGARQFYNEADPTKGKEMSGLQRGVRAGVQLGGALAGGTLGIGTMLAGGTTDQAMQMLDEGMPLDKAQAFMGADAALNTASMALGGVGKSALTQGVTTGLGNMAGDEASHLLANAFRESEGLRQNERDNVDRAISFGFGAVPGYIAKRAENATVVDNVKNVEADAKAKIEEFLKAKEAQDPLNKPSILELLPKEDYPEPLDNRINNSNTNGVIEFPEKESQTSGVAGRTGTSGKKQEFQVGGRYPHTVTYDHREDGRLVRTITYPDGQKSTETLVTDKNDDEYWVSNERYEKGEYYPRQLSQEEAATAISEDLGGKQVLSPKPAQSETKTNITGMAEDVPTIDFPLRPEAMERDRKFQRLQRDLIIERQILDDYRERGLGPEDIKQQEAAVEQARQSFAKYLDEGYGIKEAGDAYRGLYESGKELSLKIERGFDPKSLAAQKKELGLVDYYKGNSNEFVGRIKELIDAGDYNGALDYIAKTQPSTIEGKVARILRRLNDTDVFLSKDSSFGEGDNLSKSRYSLVDHEIIMSPWQSGNYKTFLHEAVHSATSVILHRIENGQTKGMALNEIAAGKKVLDLFNQVKSLSKYPDLYGFKNAREFLAEAMSSKAFQDELRSIKINDGVFKNAWHKIVDTVRQMLGLDKKYATALDRVLYAGNKLIEASTRETRTSGLNGGKGLGSDFSNKSVFNFFNPQLLENLQPSWKSRSLVHMMNIDDFLKLSSKMSEGATSNRAKKAAESGTKWDSFPYLYYDTKGSTAQIVGHEGRNRALYLKSQGFKEMPVEIRGNIRWSEQFDPNKFDYQESWPLNFKAQADADNPNHTVPFIPRDPKILDGVSPNDFAEGSKLDRYTKFEDFKNDLPPELKEHAAKYWAEAGRELPPTEQTALRNQAEAKVVEKLLKGDDRVKYLTQDTRSAEEIKGVLESYKDKDGKYKDISDNAFRNELSSGGYALSNLTQHPLVHWVTSKVMRALKEAEIKSETAISEKGKGFLAILKAGSADQIRDLSAKLLAAEGKDVDVTKAFEFNSWEKRVLESWNKAKEQALADFNKMREAKGLEPVAPRLNYLASMFTGNFRVLVKKDGKTVGWINGNSKSELQDAMKHFEGQGYEFGNPSRIPYARSKDFQKMLARRMAAFDEVINIFGKSDPEVAEFASRMENMISKQAYDYLDFKQHFKEKSGVFGAEGMKKWKDAHANAYDLWNAQAEYIRMVNQWVAQQKIEPDIKKVLLDPNYRELNATKLSENIYNNAFGRLESIQVLEKFADAYVAAVNSDFVNSIPGGKQLQKINPFEAMRSIKNWALYSALALNPGFMVSQVVQVPAATSTMMQYFADLGIQGNKGQSLTFGLWDTANHSPKMRMLAQIAAKNLGESLPDGFVSDVGQYFNKYAEENHIINPHILEKTNLYSKNPALRLVQQADEKLGGTISRPEEMTRRWAFNTLAHYLYSAGFPKEKAAEMAEVATSIAMVDYSRQSRPMIYNRLGMLGDMASTVTTFKHNAYTQLATYGFNKAPKTLMTMMGIQLLLGGLVGMYALDDADDVWSVIRSIAPETFKDTPGIKEFIMRNADEFWAFGGLAAGSRYIMPEGIDIGTKFSMDNLFPDSAAEAMFPLLSSLVETGKAAGKFALAPTATNAAGVAYPMMPAPVKGLMESTVFSDGKGGYIPSKTDQLKTKRSLNEQILRSTTGMRSLDERKESEIVFRTKNSRLRDEQLQQRYLDQAKTYSRDGDKKKTAQAIVKYMSNGGEWRNVNSFLERTYRGFVLDEIQRLSPKTLKTIRQQQQQLDLMEFQKDMEN